MNLFRLFSSCAFGHTFSVRDRNDDGELILRCHVCNQAHTPDLKPFKEKGPAHRQRPDLGTVQTKAQREKRANVFDIRESQR